MDNLTFNFSDLAVRSADKIIVQEVLFMPYSFEVYLIMVISFLLAWLFHEAMHYYKANEFGLNPVYSWDHKGSFVKINNTPTHAQDMRIIEAGVLMGCLPIIVTTFFIGLWSLIPLLVYVLGCHSDIKKLLFCEHKAFGVVKK